MQTIVYGIGGADESKPNNNIVEIYEHSEEEIAQYQALVAEDAKRKEILLRLGLTEEELNLLLGI